MKRVKIGLGIMVSIVGFYFAVSYGIFLFKKSSLDQQLSLEEPSVVIQNIEQSEQNDDMSLLQHDMNYHHDKSEQNFVGQDEIRFVIVPEQQKPLPVMMPEEHQDFIIQADRSVDEKGIDLDLCSFVTMPISDNYQIDAETQHSLDILIGNDFNQFINLILQSNNDVVSKQACRSCGLYAFFKKIKHHKFLRTDEIITLQHIVGNLYRFIETMKNLSHENNLLSLEQYKALQDLNRPQILKNNMKLQARRAAAAAALKKLQSMSNR